MSKLQAELEEQVHQNGALANENMQRSAELKAKMAEVAQIEAEIGALRGERWGGVRAVDGLLMAEGCKERRGRRGGRRRGSASGVSHGDEPPVGR